ncbi:MAG: Trk system potassium transporter TrkA [Bacteroidales bacterium]|nr:Trk system potassium transporter TrkA [Bacteroidales bacterium]
MKIVIEGAGEVGSHLAKMLSAEGGEITVIDDDEARIAHIGSTADVVAILSECSCIETYRRVGVPKADLFISVNPHKIQSVNMISAAIAKQLGAKKVIARISSEEYLSAANKAVLSNLGIDLMFFPEKIASDEIIDMLRDTASTESMDFASGKLRLAVFKIDDETSPILDMNVIEIARSIAELDPKAGFRIIAISRKGETIIPRSETKIKWGDHLYIISIREGIDLIARFFGKSNNVISKVMILGGSEVGEMTAMRLSGMKLDSVKIIDINKQRCRELSEILPDEVDVVNGDGRNSDFLLEEGLKECDAFIAVAGDDEVNILACVVARKFGVERVIAQVENLEYVSLADEMGVDAVINKKLITASRIFKFTLGDKVRFVRYMRGTDAEVMEYTVAPGSPITKHQLMDLDFPADAIIGGVIRGSESFIAVGNTHIEPYDRVAVFALPSATKAVDRFFK